MTTGYQFYDVAGRSYGLSPRQVSAIVKKHNLPKRKIYGCMAVGTDEFRQAAEDEGHKLLPGIKIIAHS